MAISSQTRDDSTQTGGESIDMLPFIAILMCVLAILILVTMAQTALGVVSAGEGWEIGDQASARIPVLVEFDGDRVVVHEGGTRSELAWNAPNPTDLGLLERLVPDKTKGYVLVAVRPSGFAKLEVLLQAIRERGLAVGYEPIPAGKKVQLIAARKGP